MTKEFEQSLKYNDHDNVMLIKDRYKDSTNKNIKTHLSNLNR